MKGVYLWRSRDLHEAARTLHGSFRITTLVRTVLDLAPELETPGLRVLLDPTLRKSRSHLPALHCALQKYPHRPGWGRLRALLLQYNATTELPDSALESLAMELGFAMGRTPHLSLASLGWTVLRFTWEDLTLHRDRALAELTRFWNARAASS